jgi:type I restriction enzyme S subunit
VTGRYGTVGEVFFVDGDFWPLNTTLYVRDFKGNDPRFISYFLRGLDFQAYSDKAAVPGINRNDLHTARVLFPGDLDEQRAIAGVLGALDDKIKLNRRMSETLEQTARALFHSWVEAGALSGDLRDVYAIADVVYGAPFKSELFNGDGVGHPLIRIRDLESHEPKTFTTEVPSRGYLVQPGDLVVGMDGEFRAHLWRGPEAWLNQRLCCFRPQLGIPRAFVHYSIEEPLAFFERSKTGTTVIHLGKRDIDEFRVAVPAAAAMADFARVADPIDQRLVLLARESRALAAIRDALLPKLISGELRIPAAA